MEGVFLLWGLCLGMIIGMGYIPHQLKKRNPKVIERVKRLLEETNND